MTSKSQIHKIPGDTIMERKRAVQQIMKEKGHPVKLKQITQTKGTLYIRWNPPFTDEFLAEVVKFANFSTIYLGPDPSEPKIVYIHQVFEEPPDMFMVNPAIGGVVALESRSLDHIHDQLYWYVEYRKKELERRRKERLEPELEPEPEPVQQSLFDEVKKAQALDELIESPPVLIDLRELAKEALNE
jgi:hypothetical protein